MIFVAFSPIPHFTPVTVNGCQRISQKMSDLCRISYSQSDQCKYTKFGIQQLMRFWIDSSVFYQQEIEILHKIRDIQLKA